MHGLHIVLRLCIHSRLSNWQQVSLICKKSIKYAILPHETELHRFLCLVEKCSTLEETEKTCSKAQRRLVKKSFSEVCPCEYNSNRENHFRASGRDETVASQPLANHERPIIEGLINRVVLVVCSLEIFHFANSSSTTTRRCWVRRNPLFDDFGEGSALQLPQSLGETEQLETVGIMLLLKTKYGFNHNPAHDSRLLAGSWTFLDYQSSHTMSRNQGWWINFYEKPK